MDFGLQPVAFSALPGWRGDDPRPAVRALLRCRDYLSGAAKPYRAGALGLTVDDFAPALAGLPETFKTASDAIHYFEQHFRAFRIQRSDGANGLVTAFYEPEIAVSEEADETFRYPFYQRPADLIDLDKGNRPEGLDPALAFARSGNGVIEPYPDRTAIDQGCLDGQGLEIAYAASKVDVFFAHVQGAARLLYADGTTRRITYAAKSGHAFSAIGKLLVDRGDIDPETVSMQMIRAWLAAHPRETEAVLWHNRSYIFFKDAPVADPLLGPVAAAKVPLEPGRSLAVDRAIHTFGTPFYVVSDSLVHMDGGPFRRLMIALDTGSAIIGPARGDIFTGSGDAAGELAGGVRNPADFYIFIPRMAAARYGHGT